MNSHTNVTIHILNRETGKEFCAIQARNYFTADTIFRERFGFSRYCYQYINKDGKKFIREA